MTTCQAAWLADRTMWLDRNPRLQRASEQTAAGGPGRAADHAGNRDAWPGLRLQENAPVMAAGVGVVSDPPYPKSGDNGTEMETANARVPTAKYTKMGETLRHVIPGHMQCSMACGGKACKYENPARWSDHEQAVKGLYSSWITDNLLAMARPSTEIIEKYNIIQQFQRCGLKTVINLQRPGEHASCGNALEQESGFTYRPETFMQANIYYYNFGWKDYGVASLTTILDMVKVMSFAVQEGKMAVHCHAGLGRTGVLLACYLVFTSRMSADQAILFVRAKRPNSIQTRGQLLCVREFAAFLVPLRSVFSCAEPKATAVTLSQYLSRQQYLLHGYEARRMKNVPKIVQLVCRLLLDIAADRQVVMEDEWLEIPDLTAEVEKTVSQQALQQLGKEMRGKGIPVPPSPLPLPLSPSSSSSSSTFCNQLENPEWRQHNVENILKTSLSRSYSDSVLDRLGSRELYLSTLKSSDCLLKHFLSQSSLTSRLSPGFTAVSPQDIISHIQDLDPEPNRHAETPLNPKKTLHKTHQSLSLDLDGGNASSSSRRSREETPDGGGGGDDVPFITLQSEISSESRILLVAKALALDVTEDDCSSKVSLWQTELNSREGAWEKLCTERDPLVLSSLMWSWLEQLKDPLISSQDVKTLRDRNNVNTQIPQNPENPQNALDSLEKGHRLTLLCILDCAARLLPMPEDVEDRFLNQTIRVFTKMDALSEKNVSLYATLKAILTPILHELYERALEENDDF